MGVSRVVTTLPPDPAEKTLPVLDRCAAIIRAGSRILHGGLPASSKSLRVGLWVGMHGYDITYCKHWIKSFVLAEGDGFELSLKIRPEENCGFRGPANSTIVPQTGAK